MQRRCENLLARIHKESEVCPVAFSNRQQSVVLLAYDCCFVGSFLPELCSQANLELSKARAGAEALSMLWRVSFLLLTVEKCRAMLEETSRKLSEQALYSAVCLECQTRLWQVFAGMKHELYRSTSKQKSWTDWQWPWKVLYKHLWLVVQHILTSYVDTPWLQRLGRGSTLKSSLRTCGAEELDMWGLYKLQASRANIAMHFAGCPEQKQNRGWASRRGLSALSWFRTHVALFQSLRASWPQETARNRREKQSYHHIPARWQRKHKHGTSWDSIGFYSIPMLPMLRRELTLRACKCKHAKAYKSDLRWQAVIFQHFAYNLALALSC